MAIYKILGQIFGPQMLINNTVLSYWKSKIAESIEWGLGLG